MSYIAYNTDDNILPPKYPKGPTKTIAIGSAIIKISNGFKKFFVTAGVILSANCSIYTNPVKSGYNITPITAANV